MDLRRGWVSQPCVHVSETVSESVGRFSKIDALMSSCMVEGSLPALDDGRGFLAPTITDSFT